MCDSCGETEDALTEVIRLYITPPSPADPTSAHPTSAGSTREAETSEHWCGVCLVHYPHRPVEA